MSCVFIGSAPTTAASVGLRAVEAHPDLKLQILVGASALLDRFGSVVDVIVADGFIPDARVTMIVEGENAGDDGEVDRVGAARAADDVRSA